MKSESIEYRDGDVTLRGFLAYDEQTAHKRPGILVMPEAFGLGKQAKHRAERLAALGYIALAGDPYGNGFEPKDLPEAMQYAGGVEEFVDAGPLGRAGVHLALEIRQRGGSRYGVLKR